MWTATLSRSSGTTPPRFTLFDNIFQTTVGPSTPNAIAMISGQSGETQWVKHPTQIGTNIPVTADPIPFWGSTLDTTTGAQAQPANKTRETSGTNGSNVSQNLTFASLPITLAGSSLATGLAGDTNAAGRPGGYPAGHSLRHQPRPPALRLALV